MATWVPVCTGLTLPVATASGVTGSGVKDEALDPAPSLEGRAALDEPALAFLPAPVVALGCAGTVGCEELVAPGCAGADEPEAEWTATELGLVTGGAAGASCPLAVAGRVTAAWGPTPLAVLAAVVVAEVVEPVLVVSLPVEPAPVEPVPVEPVPVEPVPVEPVPVEPVPVEPVPVEPVPVEPVPVEPVPVEPVPVEPVPVPVEDAAAGGPVTSKPGLPHGPKPVEGETASKEYSPGAADGTVTDT